LISIGWQWASGRILFSGDAAMAALYLGLLLLAMAVGDAVVRAAGPPAIAGPLSRDAPALFAIGLTGGAILSVGAALVQWTGVDVARFWVADLPAASRPFSNLAQPNHFNTAAFLGLVSLALLRAAGRVGSPGFWAGAAFMLGGMVISGSRTAWVQLLLFGATCAWLGRGPGRWRSLGQAAGVLATYALLYAAWSTQTGYSRAAEEVLTAGTRPAAWRDAVSAIAREPLLGHGWLQMGAAQQRVALDRPSYLEHIEHAHNIVLDLLVWTGIPTGCLILGLCLIALSRQFARLSDPRAVWLFAAALGVLAHAMLEFPLEYAYFLIPFGAALGMAHGISTPQPATGLPIWSVRASGAVLAALFLLVAGDYLKAEEDFRAMRLEGARVGASRLAVDVPDLRLLDQLEALLHVARSQPRAGMSPAGLDLIARTVQRYGMPSIQYRYALALALNGQPREATHTLQVLCHVHGPPRCDEIRKAWLLQREKDAPLRAVPFP
jgi:O-antigen ligase